MLCLCKVRNKFLVNFWNSTILLCTPCIFNLLTPNDHYSGRTAPLISKCCILYIYSTNTGTEYFKHGIYSPFFSSSKCSLFHNSNVFGSCFIRVLYTGCAKIKKIIPVPKGYFTKPSMCFTCICRNLMTTTQISSISTQKFIYCICLPSLWISFSLAHNSSTSFSIPHFWKQQKVMIFISCSCTHTDYKLPDPTLQKTQHIMLCNILYLRPTAWLRKPMKTHCCLIFPQPQKVMPMIDISFETYHLRPKKKCVMPSSRSCHFEKYQYN